MDPWPFGISRRTSANGNEFVEIEDESHGHGAVHHNMVMLARTSRDPTPNEAINPFEVTNESVSTRRHYSYWSYLKRQVAFVIFLLCMGIGALLYFTGQDAPILSNPVWFWPLWLAAHIASFWVSSLLQRIILRLSKSVIGSLQSLGALSNIRYSLFILASQIMTPITLNFSSSKVQRSVANTLLSIQLFITLWIVKELAFDLGSARRDRTLFSYRVATLYYHGRILQRICCKTAVDLSADASRQVVTDFESQRAELLSPFKLPLRFNFNRLEYTADPEAGTLLISSVLQPEIIRLMFSNLTSSGSTTILEGWLRFFPDRSHGLFMFKEYFGVASTSADAVTLRHFRGAVDRFIQRRQRLVSWMDTRENLTTLVHRILSGLFTVIMVFVIASIFDFNLSVVLTTLTSFMLSLAFAFGSTIAKMVESLIFIFLFKPYDVGDRVEIDGDQYVVNRINLLTTLMYNNENRLCMLSNQLLSSKRIFNLRKSESATVVLRFEMPNNHSHKSITTLRNRIAIFLKENDDIWFPEFSLYASEYSGPSSMTLTAKIKSGWQDSDLSSQNRSRLIEFIWSVLYQEKEIENAMNENVVY